MYADVFKVDQGVSYTHEHVTIHESQKAVLGEKNINVTRRLHVLMPVHNYVCAGESRTLSVVTIIRASPCVSATSGSFVL